uniref:K Homology domain-containing protein n=1 Tax=Ciona savignyi TaxID=51511 RepID=H2ZR33_CIOSA
MDVLYPGLIHIDGRVYCDYNSSQDQQQYNDELYHEIGEYDDFTLEQADDVDGINETEITCTADGKFKATLKAPSALFKYIIGIKGSTKRSLESETKSRIEIPKRGCEGDIIITASEKSGAISARNRIELIISEKRWKHPFTHFISIPLSNEKVVGKIKDFEEKVVDRFATSRGVSKSLFQTAPKLHLTICTLVLLNQEEVQKAKEVLKRCRPRILELLEGNTLDIVLEGLEYMNDDPTEVDVLYGKVRCKDGSDNLQTIVDHLDTTFTDAELSGKQYDRVKLHATLLNTTFRKVEGAKATRGGGRMRESFDATKILTAFRNFSFGCIRVNEIHISERHSTAANGYYSATDLMQLLE